MVGARGDDMFRENDIYCPPVRAGRLYCGMHTRPHIILHTRTYIYFFFFIIIICVSCARGCVLYTCMYTRRMCDVDGEAGHNARVKRMCRAVLACTRLTTWHIYPPCSFSHIINMYATSPRASAPLARPRGVHCVTVVAAAAADDCHDRASFDGT